MLTRPILAGRRATLAASLCLSALASLCLLPSVWRPAVAARGASLAGCAAFDLNAARHSAVGMRPSDAAAGDFNGDGRQDIVVVNGGSTFVSVLFGSASGVFTATSVEVGGGGRAAVADFNNDGRDDLLVSRPQSVAVRLGDGAGGFGPLAESAHGAGSAWPLVVADFNNDGKRDVFVGSGSFSSSKVLLGDGAGGFNSSGTLLIPVHGFADAGDFNGDGKVDLILTGGGDFFFLAPGDGAGNFTKETLFTVPTSGPVAATDLNGDGKLDVLTAGNGSVVARLGDGAGGFGPASISNAGVSARALDVGDVNADGRKDVALAGPGGAGEMRGVMRVLAGDGAGGFGPAAVFRVGNVETTAVVVGDFDGDGRGDAAAVSGSGESVFGPTPGAVSVFLGEAAAGGLGAPLSFPVGNNPFALATGDLNNDGRLDLAVANFLSGQNTPGVVNVLLGHPLTFFGPATPVNVGAQPRSVTLADVSGDGNLDLLTANRDSFNVSVLLGDGAGGFGPPQLLPAGAALSVAVADFNLDAKPDLAVNNSDANNFVLLFGDGVGGFGPPTTVNIANFRFGRFVAGDFNRDGRADLAAGISDGLSRGFGVMLGNGAGGFPATTFGVTGELVDPLVVGDFNNDGKTDIAGVQENAGQILVFYGGDSSNGLGGGGRTLTVGFSPNSIAAADFDGDGDTDLATSSTSGVVSLFASDGAGDFAPPVHHGGGGPVPRALAAGDFDGDGASDIAVVNQGGNALPFPNPPPGSVTVLVNNCDAAPPALPRITVEGGTVNEGNAGTTNATFTVRLSATSTRPVTVSHYAMGQTATLGLDFQAAPGRLTFNPGEVVKTVTVPVVGDITDEFDETFTLALAFPLNAAVDGTPASVTIVDNDPEPSLSVSDVTLTEGSGASTVAVFNVSLSARSGKPVTVAFATSDGTAQGGPDYQSTAGAVAFSPGETSKTVGVTVVADSSVEPDETFFLNLSDPTNATLNDAQGAATIRNDDAVLQFASASYSATEGADRVVLVTVARTGDTSGVSSVSYATSDHNSANERRDYTAALGRLSFAPGETAKTFEVVITDDAFAEAQETFLVTLSDAFGGDLGLQSTTTVTLNSDDATGGPSPVKDGSFNTEFFVRQHYADFLNRVPDAGGLAFWVGGIESCGADTQCREVKKVDTSAAFFLSIEFQETGFLAYRTHKAAFGNLPNTPGVPIRLRPFLSDSRRIGEGVIVGTPGWPEQLEANKTAYFNEFVMRGEFVTLHPPSLTAEKYVNSLFAQAGVPPTVAERQAAINAFGAGGTTGRAAALRSVAESQSLKRAETNKAFVLMQYFGYLRRNPDDPQDTNFDGYLFWLGKLNQFSGNYVEAEMVKAFIQSIEYGDRFGH